MWERALRLRLEVSEEDVSGMGADEASGLEEDALILWNVATAKWVRRASTERRDSDFASEQRGDALTCCRRQWRNREAHSSTAEENAAPVT